MRKFQEHYFVNTCRTCTHCVEMFLNICLEKFHLLFDVDFENLCSVSSDDLEFLKRGHQETTVEESAVRAKDEVGRQYRHWIFLLAGMRDKEMQEIDQVGCARAPPGSNSYCPVCCFETNIFGVSFLGAHIFAPT